MISLMCVLRKTEVEAFGMSVEKTLPQNGESAREPLWRRAAGPLVALGLCALALAAQARAAATPR